MVHLKKNWSGVEVYNTSTKGPKPPKKVSDWIFLQALEEEAQSEVEKMTLHTVFQNENQEVIIILLELLSLTESAYLKTILSFQQHLCKHVSMPATRNYRYLN